MTTTTTRRRKTKTAPSAEQRAEWAAARDARLTNLHEQIATGVTALVEGQAWQNMLNAARRFHRSSLGNQLLIVAQRPDATQVGFTTWKALGRQVRKGERGIDILAPARSGPPLRPPRPVGPGRPDPGRHRPRPGRAPRGRVGPRHRRPGRLSGEPAAPAAARTGPYGT